ncbi:tetratricopeptide repeat protein [Pyxidicoccus sp. MSG2]|uniref:tetratricopeptide repeat protein n=1 Tax=Pyxidicoccus sp. MSG2 TaxID=2996790 RepID=UPI0022704A38|nr:tetratricopeptide repeat protein [Pyxidicoccus sp. MSG2]MCY1015914.1 tetratricopeptide repeat protein [Pyxidicoccus sp. MSG2]
MSWVLTLSLLAAAPAQGAPAAKTGPEVEALRAKATKLYRAKKYDEACALFAHVVKLAPEQGTAFADLGLCLQKQEKKDQARAAYHRALRLSDADPATRTNVYFNLAAFEDVTPPQVRLESTPTPRGHTLSTSSRVPCAPLPSSELSCKKELKACVEEWSSAKDPGPYADFRHLTASGFNLRIYGGGKPDGSVKQGVGFCDNAPAVGSVAQPPSQTCIYWSSNDDGQSCQTDDAPCMAELDVLAKDDGSCKLVYVDPCKGRVAVACEGARFKVKKRWVGEVMVVPAK